MRHALACVCLTILACNDPGPAQPGDESGTGTGDTAETGGGTECDEGTVAGEDGQCHCGSADGPVCAEGSYCDDAAGMCVDPVCGDLPPWSPGTKLFEEATDAWGLAGVEGVRLSVTDIDSDGWPDLLVRRGGTHGEDFAGTRNTWLMRNLGAGAGFEDITESSGLLATRGAIMLGRPAEVTASADVDNDG